MAKHNYMGGFDEKESDDYEFGINPVLGVRGFRVTKNGILTGWSFQMPWHNGENIAECHVKQTVDIHGETNPCPGLEDCSHGFWAYFTDIEHDGINDETSMAIISGYGKALIGEKGFRCEKAKIEAIALEPISTKTRKVIVEEQDVPRQGLMDLSPVIGPVTSIPIGLGVGIPTNSALWALLCYFIAALVVGVGTYHVARLFPKKENNLTIDWEYTNVRDNPQMVAVMKNYPDVKIYTSTKKMMEDYPVKPLDGTEDKSNPNYGHTKNGDNRRTNKE